MICLGLNAGYAFVDDGEHPTFDVISMAGVDASTGNGNNAQNAFTEREAATVRTKFELMFNTCTQNGADVLALGTIGCGAFDNPLDAVSAAFRSVIELYAGYFSDIYRTQPIYAPTGYSFAVYGKREQFMPIKFKQDEKRIFIYFMGCGGKLSISVSNIGDLTDKKTKREVATFTLDETMQRVTAHFLPPLADISSKKVGETMNFNSGCPTSQFVHYVLCVDHNTSTLTFKHWGASTYFNSKELTIKFPKGIVYSHFSFTSSVGVEEPPRIWNLSVEYRERPSPIPPLPSEAEVLALSQKEYRPKLSKEKHQHKHKHVPSSKRAKP